jgi:hypothetical protein
LNRFLAETINKLDILIEKKYLKPRKEFDRIRTKSWDNFANFNELSSFVLGLERLIAIHPEIEWDLNETWRTSRVISRDKIDKPWTRSYTYTKYKISQWLRQDLEDAEQHMHLFKSRDKLYQASNIRAAALHLKQNQRDVIYDCHMLCDYLIFGKSLAQSAGINTFLDGICAYPAFLIAIKLTNGLEHGIQVYFAKKATSFDETQLAVILIFVLIGFLQTFKGIAVHNLIYSHLD